MAASKLKKRKGSKAKPKAGMHMMPDGHMMSDAAMRKMMKKGGKRGY